VSYSDLCKVRKEEKNHLVINDANSLMQKKKKKKKTKKWDLIKILNMASPE